MKRLLREITECVLIPAVGVLLAWRIHFRLLRLFARLPWLLTDETQRAAEGYRQFHGHAPDLVWLRQHRLVLLVDRSDAYLSATRGDRWLTRNLSRSGDWPSGPCLAITFHYGNGLWSMRDLRRAGHRAALVALRFTLDHFAGRRIPYAVARFRFDEVARAGNAPVIYTGGSTPVIRAALASGQTIVGLIDVPPGQAGSTVRTRFLDRDMLLPAGMLQLAAEAGVPVVGYTLDFDYRTGTRRLDIRPVPAGSVESQAAFLATMLAESLRDNSPAWQLWSCASEFCAPREPH